MASEGADSTGDATPASVDTIKRLRCSVGVHGSSAARRRFVFNAEWPWDRFLSELATKLGIELGNIRDVVDPSGTVVDSTADIFNDDALDVVLASDGMSTPTKSGDVVTEAIAAAGSERDMVELQRLGIARVENFVDAHVLGVGQFGMVFRARCSCAPDPNKLYAVKLIFNFGLVTQQVRNSYDTELDVLSHLAPHPNIVRYWAQFMDRVPEWALPLLPQVPREAAVYRTASGELERRQTQFLVIEYHPIPVGVWLNNRGVSSTRPLPVGLFLKLMRDLLAGLHHLARNRVLHLDLKPDNLVLSKEGRLIVIDLGCALRAESPTLEIPFQPNVAAGGNAMHLAPEVHSAHEAGREAVARGEKATRPIPYAKQPVWAAGALAYELSINSHPLPDWPIVHGHRGRRTYDVSDLPPLPPYPQPVKTLIGRMLEANPRDRLSLEEALSAVEVLAASHAPEGPVLTAEDLTAASSVLRTTPVRAPGLLGSSKDDYEEEEEEEERAGPTASLSMSSTTDLARAASEPPHHTFVEEDAEKEDDDADADSDSAEKHDSATTKKHDSASSSAPKKSKKEEQEEVTWTTGAETIRSGIVVQARDIYQRCVTVSVAVDATVGDLLETAVAQLREGEKGGEEKGPFLPEPEKCMVLQAGKVLDASTSVASAGLRHESVVFIVPRPSGSLSAPEGAKRSDLEKSRGRGDFAERGNFVEGGDGGMGGGETVLLDLGSGGMGAVADEDANEDDGEDRDGRDEEEDAEREEARRRLERLDLMDGGDGTAGSGVGRALVPPDESARDASEWAWASPRFAVERCNSQIRLRSGQTLAETTNVWGTVGLRGPPLTEGRRVWSFHVVSAAPRCGCAVGLAHESRFDFAAHNLGAMAGSLAYSKTGKFGHEGAGFAPFGEPFRTGDVIDVDFDASEGLVRFWRNGELQGPPRADLSNLHAAPASRSVLRRVPLVPAACLGSQEGGRTTRVRVVPASLRAWDASRTHRRIELLDEGATARNEGKWATAVAAHPGVVEGLMAFSVRLSDVSSGGGVAVGVVDGDRFDYASSNLGASSFSWAYSKTGKCGAGHGFRPYGPPFANGDVVTCIVDASKGVIRYLLNGAELGIAFSPDFAAQEANSSGGRVPLEGPDSPDLRGRRLVPAVCLGSSLGRIRCQVSIEPHPVRYPLRFNPYRSRPTTAFNNDRATAETTSEWTSVLLDHEGTRAATGGLTFAIRISSAAQGSGVAVGVADAVQFDPRRHNLGASPFSWAYSKTGKKGDGNGFEAYGPRFRSGDVIACDVDFGQDRVSFLHNGVDKGTAFSGSFQQRLIVPAVCIGCNAGRSTYSCVTVCPPPPLRFDPLRTNTGLVLGDSVERSLARLETRPTSSGSSGTKWYSALADHPGISVAAEGSVMSFGVRVRSGSGGFAVGVVDPKRFRPSQHNLGAAESSWAISRSGKISSGVQPIQGWQPFTERLSLHPEAILGCVVDLTPGKGTVAFFLDNTPLGVAFRDLDRIQGLTLVPAVCLGAGSSERRVSVVEIIPWVPPE